jgi:hypothetical protein
MRQSDHISLKFFKFFIRIVTAYVVEAPQNAGRVFKERSGAFNDRQRRGAMRRKIHEVTGHK